MRCNHEYDETRIATSRESGSISAQLAALKEKIQDQPPAVREELEPLMDEVIEHAVFRSRVMLLARDALQQYRVEQAALKFNLEVSRRERTTWTR